MPNSEVITRDLSLNGVPAIDEDWIGANFTPAADRSAAQKDLLALSDTLIAEIMHSDTLVFGMPIYNFGIPAALKAWVDQISRVGITFNYTETGPKGLLAGKKAIIVAASGGTTVDSDIDFATPYLRHLLGFIGIFDVEVIAADSLMANPDRLQAAQQRIAALTT
jgi:FMN-dependent NADH-azoreductase